LLLLESVRAKQAAVAEAAQAEVVQAEAVQYDGQLKPPMGASATPPRGTMRDEQNTSIAKGILEVLLQASPAMQIAKTFLAQVFGSDPEF
jgi:hypothetical protein